MNVSPTPEPRKHSNAVGITAIVATAVVLLACIAGCTVVFFTLARAVH